MLSSADKYGAAIVKGYEGTWNYLIKMITHPSWTNYFYWFLGLAILVWGIEIAFPWRKNQRLIRKDFWLDLFYMFFNSFVFTLIGFAAISNIAYLFFQDVLHSLGINHELGISLRSLPAGWQLVILFIVRDFIHWNVHVLLHKIPWLWKFHEVHHSVIEMGFSAHLRYHWMENIVYRIFEFSILGFIGFGSIQVYIIYIFTLLIGHLNHANIYLPIGPLKYIFNTPQMHIWHHAKNIPNKTGVNFGLSLSIWDYVFKTNYMPHTGKNEPLGFENVEKFPDTFWKQLVHPFWKEKTKK